MKSTLVYIADCVTRKDEANANNTFNYVEQFGRLTFGLGRGGLTIPGGSCEWVCVCYAGGSCEWVCVCYAIFYSVVKDVCCNSLCDIFSDIAGRFMFEVEKKHGSIL